MSKFVITGGAGNVSKPLTEILLKKGTRLLLWAETRACSEFTRAGPGLIDFRQIQCLKITKKTYFSLN